MKPWPQYSRLEADSDPHADTTPTVLAPNPQSIAKKTFTYLLIALTSAFITTTIFLALPSHISPTHPPALIDETCGRSVSEALAAGCKFDMMASTWESPACHDPDLLSAFLSAGPWQWYRDSNHTSLVPRSEVAKGDFAIEPLYPDSHYHLAHCMYMWRKQHRAFLRGRGISEDLWDYNHTVHCAGLVMRERWPELGRTQAGFSVCRNEAAWGFYGGV